MTGAGDRFAIETTIEVLLADHIERVDERAYVALGRNLYPTAWGCQWSAEEWESDGAKRCLQFWQEQAFRRVRTVLR